MDHRVRPTGRGHRPAKVSSLRIGTRGSELALRQARHVAALISERLGCSADPVPLSTKDDHELEDTGVGTKELQQSLLAGQVDLAVHSLKDLPIECPDGLEIIAIPERAPVADLLIARNGLIDPTHARPLGLPAGARLGTFSLLSAAQALAQQPDLHITMLRGEIRGRLEELREDQYDAFLLAAASVRRLEPNMDGLDILELGPEVMLPAAGQGALAIEVRCGDLLTEGVVALHDPEVGRLVQAERRLLGLLSCYGHPPLGCLATADDDGAVRLQAVLGLVDGAVTRAFVSRVAAVAPDPETAAQTCRMALLPELDSLQKLIGNVGLL